ncbi:MAG: hypothetical protein HY718_01375 [Planctomycetes bacterium]|nr:hypothetical protein [Planctomycetota bacterium]
MRRHRWTMAAAVLILAVGDSTRAGLQLATFEADVTPPMGSPLCAGRIKPAEAVDDPLLAKGVVLRDEGGTYVLCAVDWCLLSGRAYDLFREKIAAAVKTDVSRVAVQCVHPHDAPWIDPRAQELLAAAKDAPKHADLAYLEASVAKVAQAVKQATAFQPVTHVGTGKAKVEQVASNRRVPRLDGTIAVRYSSGGREPAMREAPEGLIDPDLRTVAFFNGDEPLAYLHYYATHPQSHYGGGRVSCDVPGIAREQVEAATGMFQVYFTGCAGNVTAGKYNDGAPQRRKELADRLRAAMTASIAGIQRQPATRVDWAARPVRLPRRRDAQYADKSLEAIVKNPTTRPVDRINAAMDLASLQRLASDRPVELSCLGIGSVRILHLPGEPFVEYQLYAQELRPNDFVAVAGYGDDFMGYLCTQKAYAEGGYEPTATVLASMNEPYVRRAIADLLADRPTAGPRLKEVRRIWDAAPHNAFTDLLRWRDRWYCTFREGARHVSDEASIRVLSSGDGEQWESMALLSQPGADLRDSKLSVTPDDRLMLVGGLRTWPPRYPRSLSSWVAFSRDGREWTPRQRVIGDDEWLWRITWHDGAAYGIGYGGTDPNNKESSDWFSRLYKSTDGTHYDEVARLQSFVGLTEATLRFDGNGRMYCIHRRDAGTTTALVGTSGPPYTQWTWRDTGFHLGGPALIFHKGQWWAAGRWVVGAARTVLAHVDFEAGTIEPVLYLPSGGDCSYPGLVADGDDIWMSYYSSHEKNTAIYLAKITFE